MSPDWIIIGRHSYYARNLGVASWLPGEKIVIGDYCSIADQVVIMTGGNRRTDQAANYPVDILGFRAGPQENRALTPVGVSSVMAKRLAAVRTIIPMLVAGRSYRSTRDTTYRQRRLDWLRGDYHGRRAGGRRRGSRSRVGRLL